MNTMKIFQHIFYFLFLLSSSPIFSQIQWTNCNASPATLTGNITNIFAADSTRVISFNSAPDPMLPNTEFAIVLNDSISNDSLGFAIIGTNTTGQIVPSNWGLSVGDSFHIAAVSYDLQQVKLIVDGVLNNYVSSPTLSMSCCNLLSGVIYPGLCDSLHQAGITDSSQVNNLNDVLTFIKIMFNAPPGALSLNGLIATFSGLNSPALSNFGCTNNANICYAVDSIPTSYDHYVITTSVQHQKIEDQPSLQLSLSPNPFKHSIHAQIATPTTGEHQITILDAMGRPVYQSTKDWTKGSQALQLNLNQLPSGMYYLQVANHHSLQTQKIIKQ